MFTILVYDVGEKRVSKALRIARKYLNWVQNSVLEGEISEANYRRLKDELKKIAEEDKDSFIFYTFRTVKYYDREIMGARKGGHDMFL